MGNTCTTNNDNNIVIPIAEPIIEVYQQNINDIYDKSNISQSVSQSAPKSVSQSVSQNINTFIEIFTESSSNTEENKPIKSIFKKIGFGLYYLIGIPVVYVLLLIRGSISITGMLLLLVLAYLYYASQLGLIIDFFFPELNTRIETIYSMVFSMFKI